MCHTHCRRHKYNVHNYTNEVLSNHNYPWFFYTDINQYATQIYNIRLQVELLGGLYREFHFSAARLFHYFFIVPDISVEFDRFV